MAARIVKRLTALAVSLALLLPVAGACGSSSSTSFNDADVLFLQRIVPHQDHGLVMARMALGRAIRPELSELLAAVDATQQTEVDQMRSWLREWNEAKNPDSSGDLLPPRNDTAAPGTELIDMLVVVPDGDFERTFLSLFIGHQHNAVSLARTELAEGSDERLKEAAKKIFESRSAQIAIMLGFSPPTLG